MADLLKDSPTDATILATFGEMYNAGEFPLDRRPTRELQDEAARKVAAKLIEDGWNEDIENATYRVGVCCFGWRWTQED
jgi:hypothetical protein